MRMLKFESGLGFEGFFRFGRVSCRVVKFGTRFEYVKFIYIEFGDKY